MRFVFHGKDTKSQFILLVSLPAIMTAWVSEVIYLTLATRTSHGL